MTGKMSVVLQKKNVTSRTCQVSVSGTVSFGCEMEDGVDRFGAGSASDADRSGPDGWVGGGGRVDVDGVGAASDSM
ncbi:UNVERIFIED_CONTAM: hypothetical protein K2H54_067090 [Gekko kuhli]